MPHCISMIEVFFRVIQKLESAHIPLYDCWVSGFNGLWRASNDSWYGFSSRHTA